MSKFSLTYTITQATYFRRGPSAKLSGIAKCVFNAAIISSCNRRVQYGEKKIVIIKLYNVNTFTIQNIMSAFVGMTIYPSNTQPKKLIQIWLQNLVGFIWLHHL